MNDDTTNQEQSRVAADCPNERLVMRDDYVSGVDPKRALQQPEPPCEKYKCGYYEQCKYEHLACEAFHWHVNTGNTVHPKMTWKKRKGEIDMSVIPTHARYLKIYGNDA